MSQHNLYLGCVIGKLSQDQIDSGETPASFVPYIPPAEYPYYGTTAKYGTTWTSGNTYTL